MSLSLLLLLLGLCHTCLLTEGSEPGYYNNENESTGARILAANSKAHENLIEGDILEPSNIVTRNAKCKSECLWKKSRSGSVKVPYKISNEYSPAERQLIESAMADFRKRTCIQFVPWKNQEDYISIENGDGCFSSVGRVGGRQRLSLKRRGCMKLGIIQHEFIHALGFYHEQSRSDRDKYVRINWQNIKEKHKKNFNKHDTHNLDTPYDYGSIMHYGKHTFAIDRAKETIIPIPDASVEIGQRKKMSKYDISKINHLYNCFKRKTRFL
ncbi:hatching enzyme 1.2 [Lates calcarifer]|uniref:Metalloendopeptidase n=1 Tax=Lates calcarifer TaxID=8187 RepID=A0AAJ7PZV0_LATCA|nr:hatching enzyme 1.2 [Lates calcarifer]